MKETVFLNGRFVPRDEAKLSVLEPGFLYGWGLFETMRSRNKKIVYLDEHLKRIKNSCGLINIKFPYSTMKLKKIIWEALEINGSLDAYLRMTVWKSASGTDFLLVVRDYHPYSSEKYKTGFSACISSFRQDRGSILSRIKSTSYLLFRLAYSQACTRGFDEAIILNSRGYITEGSRSNIFLVNNGMLFTPDLACGCLDGITRKVIFDLTKKYHIKIYEGSFTVQDLHSADEAFLTNSLMGVMPLASLERKAIGRNKCRKLTRFFIEKYNSLLR